MPLPAYPLLRLCLPLLPPLPSLLLCAAACPAPAALCAACVAPATLPPPHSVDEVPDEDITMEDMISLVDELPDAELTEACGEAR